MTNPTLPPLQFALKTIAEYPAPEQDDMQAANMREIARAALAQQAEHQLVDCRYGENGWACCEGTGCEADAVNERRVAQQAEQEPVTRSSDFESAAARALQAAWREGWDNCRDAEFLGEEAENDAFNSSYTLTRCIASDQAPQPTTDPLKPITEFCQEQESWDAADAARYRYIKGMARAMSANIDGNHSWTMMLRNIRGATLDAAIDVAMKGGA